MRNRFPAIALAFAAALVALLRLADRSSAPVAAPGAAVVAKDEPPLSPGPSAGPVAAPAATPAPASSAPKVARRKAGSPLARELNAPGADAAHDVAALHGLLRQYFLFLNSRTGPPIGNDSDLVRVLTGRNPVKAVILPPEHPAIGADGRLRDRFGTPYFVHALGGRNYEMRSAGPDRRMFTPDDAVYSPSTARTDLADLPPDPEFAAP